MPFDARELLGVKELQTLVVQGQAKRDDGGNLTILAQQVHVEDDPNEAGMSCWSRRMLTTLASANTFGGVCDGRLQKLGRWQCVA